MTDSTSRFIALGFALVPYVLIAWAYTELNEGTLRQFWIALGILLVVRTFFSIIEGFGNMLAWRLYGRQRLIHKLLAFLTHHKLPSRQYQHQDASLYLQGISEDKRHSEAVRLYAGEMYRSLELMEEIGILVGMRYRLALEAALEAYSPRAAAPSLQL